MKKLALVLLAGMCFAQTKPVKESHPTDGPGKVDTNPVVVPIPDIPVGYQDQFKTLVIKQKDIRDGEVLVTAGSVQECTYHYVASIETKPNSSARRRYSSISRL